MSSAELAGPRRGWLAGFRVYLEPASLRMFVLGFAAGLPLLLVLGTLSFRLREAGIDRSTIGHLSWVGLAYGFKWAWAPLVDRLPIPLLTRLLGRRRSWLLLAQAGIILGLAGMALVDPNTSLAAITWCALAVAFASSTQDIALDAYRIECAPLEKQAALAATYQTGYRLAMIWAGAGVLWIAARAQGSDGYDNAAWRVAYLVMAASMLVGSLTVLLSPEPAPSRRGASEAAMQLQHAVQRIATAGVPVAGVVAFGLWLLLLAVVVLHALGGTLGQALDALARPLVVWGQALDPPWLARLAQSVASGLPIVVLLVLPAMLATWRAAGGRGARYTPVAGSAAVPVLAWIQASFITPFAEFFGRYGKAALLLLALIGFYRISDVVMGIMANPFYVDMGYSKDEVAAVTKVFGVVMTIVGTFIGGVMALRWGVVRILLLGALLSAATNLGFAWLAWAGPQLSTQAAPWLLGGLQLPWSMSPKLLALVGVVSADNLASGLASAAFIAYLSGLTNIKYSATQYALFSSMMLLLPKFVAGFSGDYVDAFGYANFFLGTACLGVPVLLLVWQAARVQARHPSQ